MYNICIVSPLTQDIQETLLAAVLCIRTFSSCWTSVLLQRRKSASIKKEKMGLNWIGPWEQKQRLDGRLFQVLLCHWLYFWFLDTLLKSWVNLKHIMRINLCWTRAARYLLFFLEFPSWTSCCRVFPPVTVVWRLNEGLRAKRHSKTRIITPRLSILTQFHF